jgi:hypothetical protein
MGKIIAWLGARITGKLGGLLGGWKSFAGVGMMAILGVILYNLAVDMLEEVLAWAMSIVSSSTSGMDLGSMNVAGVAGYMVQQLRIGECLSVMVTMIILKWTLRKIPFIKW